MLTEDAKHEIDQYLSIKIRAYYKRSRIYIAGLGALSTVVAGFLTWSISNYSEKRRLEDEKNLDDLVKNKADFFQKTYITAFDAVLKKGQEDTAAMRQELQSAQEDFQELRDSLETVGILVDSTQEKSSQAETASKRATLASDAVTKQADEFKAKMGDPAVQYLLKNLDSWKNSSQTAEQIKEIVTAIAIPPMKNAVVAFETVDCPNGWIPYRHAEGRTVIGAIASVAASVNAKTDDLSVGAIGGSAAPIIGSGNFDDLFKATALDFSKMPYMPAIDVTNRFWVPGLINRNDPPSAPTTSAYNGSNQTRTPPIKTLPPYVALTYCMYQ